jgi:hypothetical protein
MYSVLPRRFLRVWKKIMALQSATFALKAKVDPEVSKWLRAKITQIELSGPNKP